MENNRKDDAVWQCTLIPFSQKVRFWSLNTNLACGEFERFIFNNLTWKDKANQNIQPGDTPLLTSFPTTDEVDAFLERERQKRWQPGNK